MVQAAPKFEVRRIYGDTPADGAYRVLVDRLWPRGVAKDRAGIDHWAKDVAPSSELRTWYGHVPEKFDEFARRYRGELDAAAARQELRRLREMTRTRTVALVTATKDIEHSGAMVLLGVLRQQGEGRTSSRHERRGGEA